MDRHDLAREANGARNSRARESVRDVRVAAQPASIARAISVSGMGAQSPLRRRIQQLLFPSHTRPWPAAARPAREVLVPARFPAALESDVRPPWGLPVSMRAA